MSDLADGPRLDLLDGPCSDLGSVLRLGSEHSESIASTGVMFLCEIEKEKYVGYRNNMSWEGDVAGSISEQVKKLLPSFRLTSIIGLEVLINQTIKSCPTGPHAHTTTSYQDSSTGPRACYY